MSSNTLDIDYAKLNIDDCFKNHYIVPDYQREYVWQEAQIEQLLSDIEAAFEENPEKVYFMGMTVVYNGGNTLELIDGQQRITTFFIILCAIINIYEKHKITSNVFKTRIYSPVLEDDGTERDAFCLELQYQDSTKCLTDIFHGKTPNEVDKSKLTESDKRLFEAYVTVKNHLTNNFTDFDELKKFAVYFFKKVQFVQIEAKDISDALKIFETINERGVGLNPMDLLKNMIFMQVSRDNFSSLNGMWKTIINKIESINEKPLRFLRYYITATYDISDSATGLVKGILPEDKIYSWLMDNDSQCNYSKKPFEFVGALTDGINRYIDFLTPNATDEGNNHLHNIVRMAGSSYKLHLLLLLAANKMDKDVLPKYKQILESVVFYFIVNRIKTNETEKLFASWCPEIRKIETEDDLKNFINSTVLPQVNKWKNDKNHHQNFMTLNIKTMQQYRIKFILARITKYVDDIRGGGTNFSDVSKCYDSQYQIEHIMPQKCNDPSVYNVAQDEFEYQVNMMGNLTLMEKTFNAACQNASYKDKCKIYPNSCFYLTSALFELENVGKNTAANNLNKKLSAWSKWNKKAIEERQEMLYGLSENIWDIDLIVDGWK